MTTIPTTEEFWGVDSYLSFAFPLNSDGSLQAEDTNPYVGLEVDGTRNFNIAAAQGTTVANVGNGRLRDTIYRAPREPSRAEFTIGYTQQALKAKLSGVKTYNVGEMLGIGRLTNKQGSEPDIALMVIQRGHNENGLTRYRTYFVPKSRIVPRDSPLNENASEEILDVTMANSKKQIWGKPFTKDLHGFTDATYEEYVSEGVTKIVAWQGDGSEDTFLLPDDFPASSVGKLSVYNFATGGEYTGAQITKAVDQFQLSYPTEALIVAVYEYDPNE